MLTIGGEVTWQRDGETGEWKIRPTEENDHARPNIVGRLDQSPMGSYLRFIQTKTETKALGQLVKWKTAALAAIDAYDETIWSTPSVEVSTKENRYGNNNSK